MNIVMEMENKMCFGILSVTSLDTLAHVVDIILFLMSYMHRYAVPI